ncbi:MAG: glycosyltransferase [Candidatus Pacebacteria bacterium]|nr:glycosyltransferase [Candidatus Paceibacterota bacterium]
MSKKHSVNNILLVANYPSDVGYAWWLMENFWAEISKCFSEQNRATFLVYPKIDRIPQKILESPLKILEHDFSDRTWSGLRSLRSIISTNRISSVYLTDRRPYDWFYFCLRRCGVRQIINHYHWANDSTPLPPVRKYLTTLIHRIGFFSCDHYIGVSKCVRDRYIKPGCIPAYKCSYVLNGIEPITPDASLHDYVYISFDIPFNTFVVVTVGRACFYKGYELLIKCANFLINDLGEKDVYFLQIGDGPDLETFKKMASQYGLERKVLFAGHRNDVRKILPSCHIGVQFSKGEAFSLAILEYLSAGLATLAPDNCGNPEAIEHGVTGILYGEQRDYKEIAKIIQSLLHNEQYRERLGSNAIKSVNEKFNITRTNKELISLIEKIM